MEQKDTIRDLLYEKMSNEQKDFVENLKHLPPEKIIRKMRLKYGNRMTYLCLNF